MALDLCNPAAVKALLHRHGFRFSKSLGQNFLIASWVPERIAQSCGAGQGVSVFEVGPGIGPLTYALSFQAEKVLAAEIDRALSPILQETLGDRPNVEIEYGDVLKMDLPVLLRDRLGDGPMVACANIPYYITTPVLTALLGCGCFKAVTVMVQKEVALRMEAQAGTPDYSAFSVYIQYHARPQILFDVPADCFLPRPKVDSAVIRLDVLQAPPFPVADEEFYFRTVKAAFGQRRKTLCNALSAGFPALSKEQAVAAIARCGFPADIRGERLSPKDFAALSRALAETPGA